MPYDEPPSYPDSYDNPDEWRAAYKLVVDEFKASTRTDGPRLSLEIALKRLGYKGALLERELAFIIG